MEKKIKEENLLVEYEMAQLSAEHHDNVVWQIVSAVWGGSLILFGFVLGNLENPTLRIPIIIACSLGIILTSFTWYHTSSLRKIRMQKYERCKSIEMDLGFTQHRSLQFPKGKGFLFLSVIMACFIIVWVSIIYFEITNLKSLVNIPSAANDIQTSVQPMPTKTIIQTCAPLTTPIPNDSGLTIEENEIVGEVSLEPLTFTPVHGSQQEILERHAFEKGDPYSFGMEISADSGGHDYKANESDDGQGGMVVTVSLDGEVIFEVDAGDISPINPLQSFWVNDGHWVLEIAYVDISSEDSFVVGKVYQDGVCLNEQYGYEEMFGYQLLGGKPFYFYQVDREIHLSYDGTTLPNGYNVVYHFNCCSGSVLNPSAGSNWVGFWGERNEIMYYTEIGKY